MKALVDCRNMKEYDAGTIAKTDVTALVLMERAARGVVEEILNRPLDTRRILVVCGLGNNGGDGFCVARLLFQRGYDVTVVCPWEEEKASPQTRIQRQRAMTLGIPMVEQVPHEEFTLIVDAIFGIGLSREIRGFWQNQISLLNEMTAFKVAVDIPSGICTDTGQDLGCAFRADLTVTFAYEKIGMVLFPGFTYCGEVVVKDIGISAELAEAQAPWCYTLEPADLSLLPARSEYSNKGTYGKVLVVAGRKNMAGAAFFSAKAAAKSGCGMVSVFTEEANRVILQQLMPEAILETYEPLPEVAGEFLTGEANKEKEKILLNLRKRLDWADVVVVGPGLGTDETAAFLLESLLSECTLPMIWDADALNLLAKKKDLWEKVKAPVIVTPHLGEMSRLSGLSIGSLQRDLCGCTRRFAMEHRVICVCKDARTVIALPNGKVWINTAGNNGCATAGSGDVLTGVMAGLLAQGLKPSVAAVLGVYVHALAADAMVETVGHYSMMATDLLQGITEVLKPF